MILWLRFLMRFRAALHLRTRIYRCLTRLYCSSEYILTAVKSMHLSILLLIILLLLITVFTIISSFSLCLLFRRTYSVFCVNLIWNWKGWITSLISLFWFMYIYFKGCSFCDFLSMVVDVNYVVANNLRGTTQSYCSHIFSYLRS